MPASPSCAPAMKARRGLASCGNTGRKILPEMFQSASRFVSVRLIWHVLRGKHFRRCAGLRIEVLGARPMTREVHSL